MRACIYGDIAAAIVVRAVSSRPAQYLGDELDEEAHSATLRLGDRHVVPAHLACQMKCRVNVDGVGCRAGACLHVTMSARDHAVRERV